MSARNSKVLPTDQEVAKLKKELNFLLWTTDTPRVPEGVSLLRPTGAPSERLRFNIQCAAHTIITAGFFLRRGFQVTTRGGKAFLLDPSPDQNPHNDLLHEIGKHWWLSLDEHGLVDLSLSSESENPLVYRNQSIGDIRWKIVFGESAERLRTFINERKRGCFYLTLNKTHVTELCCEESLAQPFLAARGRGVDLTFGKLVAHCEALLAGSAETMTRLSQLEAWQKIAASDSSASMAPS